MKSALRAEVVRTVAQGVGLQAVYRRGGRGGTWVFRTQPYGYPVRSYTGSTVKAFDRMDSIEEFTEWLRDELTRALADAGPLDAQGKPVGRDK